MSKATCATCASYSPHRRWCSEWGRHVGPDESCGRYAPAEAAQQAPAQEGDGRPAGRMAQPAVQTTREMVLQLRANGLSAPAIAERLGVSRQLVNYHLRQARKRAERELGGVLLVIPAPVAAPSLVRLLEAAVQVWGDGIRVLPGEGCLQLVREAA